MEKQKKEKHLYDCSTVSYLLKTYDISCFFSSKNINGNGINVYIHRYQEPILDL